MLSMTLAVPASGNRKVAGNVPFADVITVMLTHDARPRRPDATERVPPKIAVADKFAAKGNDSASGNKSASGNRKVAGKFLAVD